MIFHLNRFFLLCKKIQVDAHFKTHQVVWSAWKKNPCQKRCVASDECFFFFQSKKNRLLKASGVHSKLPPTILLKQLHLVFHCHTKADPECCHRNQMSPPSASSPTFACLKAGEGEGTNFKARSRSLCRELNRNGTSFCIYFDGVGCYGNIFLLL